MFLCFAGHKLGDQLYANIYSPIFLKGDFLKIDYMFDIKIYPCFVYSLLILHPDTIAAPRLWGYQSTLTLVAANEDG